jgi:hypothetical protein
MVDGGMNYLYTIGGYATLFGVGYAVYHMSTQQDAKKRSQAKSAKAGQPEPRKEDRKKKQRLEAFAQEAQESAGKAAKSPVEEEKEAPAAPVSSKGDTVDESAANREFAKQLAKAKQGTKFAARSDSKQREKSVKQSRANQMQAFANKDPLPVNESEPETDEPVDNAATTAVPAEAGRVDDMLEPAQSGPSVLRLTGSTAQEQQQKKNSKAPEKVETKKQRQNRKKAEAARAARDGAETERKTLEEKQRREARIAEGRAAKDGSQFTNVAVSAWKQGAPNGANGNKETLHQPLDTFEPSAPAVSAPAPAKKQPKEASKSDSNWVSSVPSEEDQMKILSTDDEWSTVKTKGSKKKGTNGNSADEAAPVVPVATTRQSAPISAPKANGKASNKSSGTAFGGSFSALTNNDATDEEQEEEWDV